MPEFSAFDVRLGVPGCGACHSGLDVEHSFDLLPHDTDACLAVVASRLSDIDGRLIVFPHEVVHVLQVRKLLFQNFPPCSGELCEGKKRGEKKGCRGRWNGPRIRCKCGVVTHKGCHRCKE